MAQLQPLKGGPGPGSPVVVYKKHGELMKNLSHTPETK